ncbi:immunity protein Imm33 domain-containing protein [Burkholderia sp. LMG 21824]|uniref:immunity protein Imm33 domain-containing protein n=1 Tax=Burkholderia sp. LMG 21824 TaxID=3158172 RepID=UPI003C304B6B
MIFKSKIDRAVKHPNFIVSASGDYDQILHSLFEHLESEIRSGKRFDAGQTIQFGWMVLMLNANGQGDLEIWEPDFSSMPINWEFSLDKALRDMYLQRELCAQAGLAPEFPSLLQRGIVSPVFVPNTGFVMSREAQQDGDSGWFFLGREDQRDKGKYCSLFEISITAPWIVPFLALPPEVIVKCDLSSIEIKTKNGIISSNNNEILRKLLDKWNVNGRDVLH